MTGLIWRSDTLLISVGALCIKMLFVILFIVMFLRVAGLYLIVFLPRLNKVLVGARMHEFFKDLKNHELNSLLDVYL